MGAGAALGAGDPPRQKRQPSARREEEAWLYPKLESVSDLPGWFATELGFYGFVASALTGVIILAILSVALVTSWVSGSRLPLAVGRRLAQVCVVALVIGAPANLVFTAVMRYHFYIPGDPLVD